MASRAPDNKWKSRLNFAARLVAILILGAFLVLSDEQRGAIAKVLRDPMSILADRSPGARGNAALRQTKIRKQFAKIDMKKLLDRQQVLHPEELAPEHNVFVDVGAIEPDDPVLPTDIADNQSGEVADADTPPAPPPPNRLWTGSGFFHVMTDGNTGGGGNNGGSGGNSGACVPNDRCASPTGDPTPPIVSVPEPATWLLILVGFFSLGGILRFARLSFGRSAVSGKPHID